MQDEERYVDCDVCGERYVGEDAIRSYIREQANGRDVCISCLKPVRLTDDEKHVLKEAWAMQGTWLIHSEAEKQAAKSLKNKGLVSFDPLIRDKIPQVKLTPLGRRKAAGLR
jgi:hypothetical protein